MAKHYDIMVIDDEQVILDAVNRICKAEDFAVDTCLDAETALQRIAQNGYRLVLCDLMLSDIDGFQFLDMLSERKIDVQVVMMTGFSTMENAVKSLHEGAIDFIPKPFTTDELCSTLARSFKYVELKELEKTQKGDILTHIPCPAKFYRLGYAAWITKDMRGAVFVGVTDLFLKTIQSVKRIKTMSPEEEMNQGSYCASLITAEDMIHPLIAPLSGRIIEINSALQENYTLVEKDPYFKGWIYRIIPHDLDFELKNLISCSIDI